VRFHLPSKVFFHENAASGVERGNIVSWRREVAQADARPLAFGAVMDDRSILFSTVLLFATAIALAGALLAGAFYLVARRGRKALQREAHGKCPALVRGSDELRMRRSRPGADARVAALASE
jgi:hypothetical protein